MSVVAHVTVGGEGNHYDIVDSGSKCSIMEDQGDVYVDTWTTWIHLLVFLRDGWNEKVHWKMHVWMFRLRGRIVFVTKVLFNERHYDLVDTRWILKDTEVEIRFSRWYMEVLQE